MICNAIGLTTDSFESIYVTGGAEVAEVYGGLNYADPIFYKTQTMTGSAPLVFDAYPGSIRSYTISGNTVQNGTPTPEAPVDVVGCGVRTGNLVRFFQEEMRGTYYGVDVTVKNAEITLNGTVSAGSGHWVEIGYKFGGGTELTDNVVIPCKSETTYTIATDVLDGNSSEVRIITFGISNENKTINIGSSLATIIGGDVNRIFISLGAEGVVFNKLKFRIMFNEGSTPLPYEPYGYKIPITCGGETNNIYLGQVETTRRVKKLVFDGTEGWQNYRYVYNTYRLSISSAQSIGNSAICSHFVNSPISEITSGKFTVGSTWIYICYADVADLADFKSYLAAQYSAGTPVTVWYVLDEPETSIVNEPIHKIGGYADTITMAQAGETIPTIAGSNTLTVGATVQPSSVSITGHIKPTTP